MSTITEGAVPVESAVPVEPVPVDTWSVASVPVDTWPAGGRPAGWLAEPVGSRPAGPRPGAARRAASTGPRHARREVRLARRVARAVGRWADRALNVAVAVGCVVAAMALVGSVAGYRGLVVESGSMRPAIPVGALVVSERIHPLEARPGQVVTFRDELLGNRLVTHRLVQEVRDGDVVHITTKGDANRTVEHWTVPVSGQIGRAVLVVPGGGRILAELGTATGHLVLIWLVVTWAAVLAVRWVVRLGPGRHRPAGGARRGLEAGPAGG